MDVCKRKFGGDCYDRFICTCPGICQRYKNGIPACKHYSLLEHASSSSQNDSTDQVGDASTRLGDSLDISLQDDNASLLNRAERTQHTNDMIDMNDGSLDASLADKCK